MQQHPILMLLCAMPLVYLKALMLHTTTPSFPQNHPLVGPSHRLHPSSCHWDLMLLLLLHSLLSTHLFAT